MVMKMSQPIGSTTAQGQEFDYYQEKIVDSPRQSQIPMDEVVRYRSIGYKAEGDDAEQGRDPELLCSKSEVSSAPREGADDRTPAAKRGDPGEVMPKLVECRVARQ